MAIDDFALAASINDLTREPEARGVADFVEFRMDKAADPLDQLDAYDGDLPVIATNRATWFGGTADDDGRLDRLFAASRHEAVAYVDVELETVRAKEWVVEEFRENDVSLIVSHHDFDDTPERDVLDAIVDESAEYGDVAKVATSPRDESDTLALLAAVRAATRQGVAVAGIAMGELGSYTRVVAHRYGSKLGYAPLASDDTDYAPGQIPLERLASLVEATREVTDEELADALDGEVTLPDGLALPD